MSETRICPLCHKSARVQALQGAFADYVSCEKCGDYILESDLRGTGLAARPRCRSAMYYYLTQQVGGLREKKIIPHFYYDPNAKDEGTIVPIGNMFSQLISVSTIEYIYPKDYDDRISMTMVNLANEVQYIGNVFSVRANGDPDMSHLFFLDESFGPETYATQLLGILNMLKKLELVEALPVGTQSPDKIKYSITPKGWQLVQEYQKTHKSLPQGFIAMWFDDSMKLAKVKIIEAIKDSGYIPMVIDMKEHNNQIVPEILFEIDRSEFVVADLTGGRGGVYYEAGYAAGREKPVIICCREDEFGNIHFDLKQKSAIKWINEEDLYKRLKDRIEATIGKRSPTGER